MNYLQRNRNKYPNFLKIIFIVTFFILLSVFSFLFPKAMRSVLTTTAIPIWTVRDTIIGGFQNVTGFFSFKSALVSQVSSLQNQITTLELKQTDYDAVVKENQDLKNLYGRSDSNIGMETASGINGRILARVLSAPPQSPYDTFVLDAGSANGLSVSNKVYISDTILIGEIGSVTDKTSIVNLFSKSGMTNSLTLSRTGAVYDVKGLGGANMSVEVPKDADILWGDVFEYPNLKTSVVGSVYYIDQSAQSSFKNIFIRVPGNVFQTKWVMVDT